MTAIEQLTKSLGLDRRCSGFCGKCDFSIQDRFDSASGETRRTFIDALASCEETDFDNPRPILALVTLLNPSEFEQFIARMVQRAPFGASFAWRIIRGASTDISGWFIGRRTATFQRQFHLHPTIAPLLLNAAIRPESEESDAIGLLDYFAPIASINPILMHALPRWRAAKEREEDERRAELSRRAEQARLEAEAARAKWAAREAEFKIVESRGLPAIVKAVLVAPSLNAWDCSERWSELVKAQFTLLPREDLQALAHMLSRRTRCGPWRSLYSEIHVYLSDARSAERQEWIADRETLPLTEKLSAACESKWALTYFPENWAVQLIHEVLEISDGLRARMLSKLMRLQRRGPWLAVRHLLLRRT